MTIRIIELPKQEEVIEERVTSELAPSTSSSAVPPADVERAPSYDEVDDRGPSTVLTQKEEVTEQIIDQGESISELVIFAFKAFVFFTDLTGCAI